MLLYLLVLLFPSLCFLQSNFWMGTTSLPHTLSPSFLKADIQSLQQNHESNLMPMQSQWGHSSVAAHGLPSPLIYLSYQCHSYTGFHMGKSWMNPLLMLPPKHVFTLSVQTDVDIKICLLQFWAFFCLPTRTEGNTTWSLHPSYLQSHSSYTWGHSIHTTVAHVDEQQDVVTWGWTLQVSLQPVKSLESSNSPKTSS